MSKTSVMGKNGVLDGMKKGMILVDMSSIAPLVSKEVVLPWKKRAEKC